MDTGKRFAIGLGIVVAMIVALLWYTSFSPDEQWRQKYYYDSCSYGCANYQPEEALKQKMGKPSQVVYGPAAMPVPRDAAIYAPSPRESTSPGNLATSVLQGQHVDIYRSPSGRYAVYVTIDKNGKDISESFVSR